MDDNAYACYSKVPYVSVGYCKALDGAWVDTIETTGNFHFMHSVEYENIYDSSLLHERIE